MYVLPAGTRPTYEMSHSQIDRDKVFCARKWFTLSMAYTYVNTCHVFVTSFPYVQHISY